MPSKVYGIQQSKKPWISSAKEGGVHVSLYVGYRKTDWWVWGNPNFSSAPWIYSRLVEDLLAFLDA